MRRLGNGGGVWLLAAEIQGLGKARKWSRSGAAGNVYPVDVTFRPIQLQQISRARLPLAVKGSGHAINPAFSSTPRVHISMTRFNDIVIQEDCQTVEVWVGLTWTDVYKYLVLKGLNVVGGRLDGVGVAGLTLGRGE